MPFSLTTLGEVMLRLSVPAGERLEAAAQLHVFAGGAESNVAAALAALGWTTALATALPNTPPGRIPLHALRAAGVDTRHIVWREGRIGTYYAEFAVPPRPIHVTYDRADSCAARMTSADINWDALLETRLLHLTGITPALSPSCAELTEEAIRRARDKQVSTSFDVNYRGKLWSPIDAANTLFPLMQNVEILFCKDADARLLFGYTGETTDIIAALAKETSARWVIMTVGEDGVYGWHNGSIAHQPAIPIPHIIDRFGAGDALAAGVLHAWLAAEGQPDLSYALACGTLLAALALTQRGDMVRTTRAEFEALLSQPHSGLHR